MLTISALEETKPSTQLVDKSTLTPEQREADDYIKSKIKTILNRQEAEEAEINEIQGAPNQYSQRRLRRNLWKNISQYLTTGGFLAVHVSAIWLFRFISYKLISNKEIMSSPMSMRR